MEKLHRHFLIMVMIGNYALNFKVDTWLEIEGVLQKRIVKDADEIQPVSNLQAEEDGTPYFVVKGWKMVSAPQNPYLEPPM